jgi:hypothetical protein
VAIFSGFLIYGLGQVTGFFVQRSTGKKPDRWAGAVKWLSISFVPVACLASLILEIGAFDPAPWFKPTNRDIVGTWVLTADPTDEIRNASQSALHPARELVFDANGAFQANGIPDLWSYTDFSKQDQVTYISGSGVWYLGQIQGTQRLEWTLFTEFQEIDGHVERREMRYYFQGHLPPYTIATLDAGYRRFHFRKKK